MQKMDQYAEQVDDFESFKEESPYVKFVERYTMLTFAGKVKDKQVLDLGCGYGYYARLFAESGAKYVLGVDYSEAMVAVGKSINQNEPLSNLEFMEADATNLNLGKTFDLIFVNYVLNHAKSIEVLKRTCQKMFDHLKPGGKVICSIINGRKGRETCDCLDIQNYGYMTRIDPVGGYDDLDGKKCVVEFLDQNGTKTASCTCVLYNNSTMEAAFRKTGFKVQFRHFMISDEGFEKLGDDFWKPLINQNPDIVVVAKK